MGDGRWNWACASTRLSDYNAASISSAPYHPATNGLAERAVQTVKDALKKTSSDIDTRLSRFLFQYRLTPHSSTGQSPAKLLLGRVPRSHLDFLFPDVADNVKQNQQRQKQNHDQRATERFFVVGDKVYALNHRVMDASPDTMQITLGLVNKMGEEAKKMKMKMTYSPTECIQDQEEETLLATDQNQAPPANTHREDTPPAPTPPPEEVHVHPQPASVEVTSQAAPILLSLNPSSSSSRSVVNMKGGSVFHMWYLDDGIIAGPKLSIVQDLGPPNGLYANTSKCELYSTGDLSIFPSEMKSSKVLNFEILGAPIGDFVFCVKFASQKRAKAQELLHMLEECWFYGSSGLNLHMDPPEFQVALKWCMGMDLAQGLNCTFCPSLALDPLGHYAITCKHWGELMYLPKSRLAVALGMTNTTPDQQMFWSPNWSLGKPAAFDLTITSQLNPSILCEAGVTAGSAALVVECRKHDLNDPKCSKLSWKCTPLAVETYGCWGAEARETLAVETYGCWGAEARETLAVETYGCWGAEARETLAVETYGCWGAEARETLLHLAAHLAIPMRCTKSQATASIYGRFSPHFVPSPGLGLSLDPNEHQMAIKWWLGLNTSPGSPPCALCPEHPLDPLGHHARVAQQGQQRLPAELRKHSANDAKCSELRWTCIPLVAESYGAWGSEAVQAFSRLASYLATRTNSLKSKVVCSLYGQP
eukprot:Em0018g1009a